MIADISGYTEYLEGTELAHEGVISKLLETLIDAGPDLQQGTLEAVVLRQVVEESRDHG